MNKRTAKSTTESTTTMSSANIVYLIIALFILLLVIIFALQNADDTKITFLQWQFRSSLAIVLFLTFMTGILIGVFTSLANLIRKDRIITRQVKKIESLEQQVDAMEYEIKNR